MGIDARMFVTTKSAAVTKAFVKDAAYQLAAAFGADRFFIDRDRKWNGAHALELISEYQQDGPTLYPEPGEKLIEVNLWTRYYGHEYERGDLPFIVSVAEWLERKIPDSDIWYGGDSSGVRAKLFDHMARSRLFDHFVAVGHEPYRVGWDSETNGLARYCDFCDKPMLRYGWGGRGDGEYAAFHCHGCGFDETTRDGGKTWQSKDEKAEQHSPISTP